MIFHALFQRNIRNLDRQAFWPATALGAGDRLRRALQRRASSAINTLAGHVRLAYVSKTPRRTQLINPLPSQQRRAASLDLFLAGYAKRCLRRSAASGRGLTETYLRTRESPDRTVLTGRTAAIQFHASTAT